MKKLASVLLIILYATASSGASFHFHFCMGHFRGIGFAAVKKQVCDKCGMTRAGKGCCTDVVKTFKVLPDQSPSSVSFDFTQYAYTLPNVGSYAYRAPLFASAPLIPFITGPPEPLLVPIFIRDCSFRI